MITSLAIDREFAYTLDTGVITRHKLTANGNTDAYAGPAGTVSQVMTTNEAVFALSDSGVYRRDNDTDTWDEITVPVGTEFLSSSDDSLYVLVAGDLFQQDKDSGPFVQVADTADVAEIAQVDHDEQFGYALLDSGQIWLRKMPDGSWFRFRDLANVVQVVAGLDFVYARTTDGNVYRSKVFGESAWETLNTNDVTLLAIASDHTDRLWMVRGGALASVSIFDFGEPMDLAWVAADWVDEDWVMVA